MSDGPETDPNEARLEIAAAFIEINDIQGAREALNEVLRRGSPEQQARAKALLATLG